MSWDEGKCDHCNKPLPEDINQREEVRCINTHVLFAFHAECWNRFLNNIYKKSWQETRVG